jgi:hypothetical protein
MTNKSIYQSEACPYSPIHAKITYSYLDGMYKREDDWIVRRVYVVKECVLQSKENTIMMSVRHINVGIPAPYEWIILYLSILLLQYINYFIQYICISVTNGNKIYSHFNSLFTTPTNYIKYEHEHTHTAEDCVNRSHNKILINWVFYV